MELQSIKGFAYKSFNIAYNGVSNVGSTLFNALKKHPYATALTIAALGVAVIVRRPEFIEAMTSVNKSSRFVTQRDKSIYVTCTKKVEINQVAEGLATIAGVKVPPKIDATFDGFISNQGSLKNIVLVKLFNWLKTPFFIESIKFSNSDGIYSDCTPLSPPQDCCDQIAEFLKI